MVRQELLTGQRSKESTADRIARETIPRGDNEGILASLWNVHDVVEDFIDETNNWFEILDVRVYKSGVIGIPCKYRWTIVRWAKNDMDQWLLDNGWDDVAHLAADSREREDNELEARYVKEIGGHMVNATFLVEFPDRVFEEMNDKNGMERAKEKSRERTANQTAKNRILQARRS